MEKTHSKFLWTFIAIFFTVSLTFCSGSGVKDDGKVSVRVSVNKMESEGVDTKIVKRATELIYKKLQELKGKNRVVSREIDGVDKSANRQLIGRLSKLGAKIVITVKVVEGERGKLVFNETAIVKESDLDDAILDIAENIADKDEVW